jgi:diacylglycerol O-acyltransferase / wax synthase
MPSSKPSPPSSPDPAARYPGRMNPSDAVMWDIERDPELRSTVVAVAILDQEPEWERLVHRLDIVSQLVPRLRQRVVVPPFHLGFPLWVEDELFDISYHVRRVQAPEPGTLREVLDLAQPLAMTAFDPARPLWEFTLVEGMVDGRAALIQKFHHTLTDGVGAIELALNMLDTHRDDADPEPPPGPAAAAGPDPLAAVGRALSLPIGAARSALGAIVDPLGTASRAFELAQSVAKTVAPVPPTASELLTERSLGRRFETIDISLADLKAAAKVARGTVNDAFLAAVVEGLRRYHERHGAGVDELRLTMPISLRHEGDDLGGNHFAPARFAVPTTIADPVERMQQLGQRARAWEAEPALAYTDAIAHVLHRLPIPLTTGVFGAMLKNVDTVVTNVPGLTTSAYLAGAEVVKEYAFAPPTGAAMNVSLISHVGVACIGVVIDTAAVPDEDLLMTCLVEGFEDVLSVAEHHAVRTA